MSERDAAKTTDAVANTESVVNAATILDVPLSKEDEAMMLLTGFAYRAEDGILTLTEKGGEWVREWCAERRKALDGTE